MIKVGTYDPPTSPRLASAKGRPSLRPTSASELRECLVDAVGEGLSLVPVGGGRHLGQGIDEGAALLDMRGMDRILSWDRESCTVTVEPGVSIGALEDYLSRRGAGLSGWRREHPEATIGGLLAAAQPVGHNLWNGSVRDVCVALSAITGAGETYKYLAAPRKSAGPDLRHLFIGGEGRYGVITAATVGVSRAPEARVLISATDLAPDKALGLLAGAFARGMRASNVLYSGAERQARVWLEGGQATIDMMRAALGAAAESEGVRLDVQPMDEGPEPQAWGLVRSGGDPVASRGEDPEGAVSVWGSPVDLAGLPQACWSEAVIYNVSAHQACVLLPCGSKGAGVLGAGSEARTLWWGSKGAQVPCEDSGVLMAKGLVALKRMLDPHGVLPSVASKGGEA